MDPLIWLVLSGIVGLVLLVAGYFSQKPEEKKKGDPEKHGSYLLNSSLAVCHAVQ